MAANKRHQTHASRKSKKTYSKDNFALLIRNPRRLLAILLLLLAIWFIDPELLPDSLTKILPDTLTELPAAEHEESSSDISGDLRVEFLDVGQGLSVLAEADGSFFLYDGGDRGSSSFVVSYLEDRGVECLDYVIASHYDADHLNGLVGALNTVEVKRLLGPDYRTDSRVYQSFTSKAKELQLEIEAPEPGSRYPFGKGYFEVLAPISDDYSDVNNYSIVIRLVYGENSILLTGDAETESEAEILSAGEMVKSTVLCVGHHGSPSSSSIEFLNAVQPDYAIISCGKNNSYGHPDASVLKRLEELQIPIWRTDESGTICIYGNGKTLSLSSSKH